MVSKRAAHRDPLDALVLEVWHVELSACQDYVEFREGVRRMTHNLELTLATVARWNFLTCIRAARSTI